MFHRAQRAPAAVRYRIFSSQRFILVKVVDTPSMGLERVNVASHVKPHLALASRPKRKRATYALALSSGGIVPIERRMGRRAQTTTERMS